MRNAFARIITEIATNDKRVLLLSGDIGNRLFDGIKSVAEDNFINCGIAEANMMGVAAGLALSDFLPVVYTITPFTTTRCFEQIRVDVCYHELPVVIVGTGSGLSYASLGPTHHSCEDIAILRTLPNMTVFCPADSVELELGLKAAIGKMPGPLYIRIGKKGEPILHKQKPEFAFGKAITLKDGHDACIISTGTVTSVALESAHLLEEKGLSVRVESFHTVKPLDKEKLDHLFDTYPLILTVEEHGRIGGLYSAVSEYYVEKGPSSARILSCAVEDEFLHLIGDQDIARAQYGLSTSNIVSVIEKACGTVNRGRTADAHRI